MKREIDYYNRAENAGLVNKLVMGLVLIHLHRGDYVAADQAFKSCLNRWAQLITWQFARIWVDDVYNLDHQVQIILTCLSIILLVFGEPGIITAVVSWFKTKVVS